MPKEVSEVTQLAHYYAQGTRVEFHSLIQLSTEVQAGPEKCETPHIDMPSLSLKLGRYH